MEQLGKQDPDKHQLQYQFHLSNVAHIRNSRILKASVLGLNAQEVQEGIEGMDHWLNPQTLAKRSAGARLVRTS